MINALPFRLTKHFNKRQAHNFLLNDFISLLTNDTLLKYLISKSNRPFVNNNNAFFQTLKHFILLIQEQLDLFYFLVQFYYFDGLLHLEVVREIIS